MNRYRIIKKKKLSDKQGSYLGDSDKETGVIRINMGHKDHKDKAELASTIKHELLHLQHPKMTEKEVYKKSAKTKLTQSEKRRLLAKLYSKTA